MPKHSWKSYRDFVVKIEPVGAGIYRADAQGPTGEAQATFALPFDEKDLRIFLLEVNRPRQARSRGRVPEPLKPTIDFGRQLYDAVWIGDVRDLFVTSRQAATQKGLGLRIRLRLSEAPELADLPWEYLYDGRDFLALSEDTPLIHYLDLPDPPAPLRVSLPLRILVTASAPRDLAPLDIEQEVDRIHHALAGLITDGLIELDFTPDATLKTLQRTLRSARGGHRPYHIWQFIGHGQLEPTTRNGTLDLCDEHSFSSPTSGFQLGTLFKSHLELRLAMLNACEGARSDRTDPFSSVASALVERGLPAVIGMQFEISDQAAIAFSEEFYAALVDGLPIDAALTEARRAIFFLPNWVEWATPVLFMRSPTGVLFNIHATPERLADLKAGAQRAAAERLAAQKMEQERVATEKAEAERLAAQKAEEERLAREKAEHERIAAEKEAAERREREATEQIAIQKAEEEHIAAQKAEEQRFGREKAEQDRITTERLEFEPLEREAAKRRAAQQAEADRLAWEKAEANRLATQKAEEERLAAKQTESELLAVGQQAVVKSMESRQPGMFPVEEGYQSAEQESPAVQPVEAEPPVKETLTTRSRGKFRRVLRFPGTWLVILSLLVLLIWLTGAFYYGYILRPKGITVNLPPSENGYIVFNSHDRSGDGGYLISGKLNVMKPDGSSRAAITTHLDDMLSSTLFQGEDGYVLFRVRRKTNFTETSEESYQVKFDGSQLSKVSPETFEAIRGPLVGDSQPTSPDGRLRIYMTGSGFQIGDVASNKVICTMTFSEFEDDFAWSPDSKQIAFRKLTDFWDIFLVNDNCSGFKQLTMAPGHDIYPVWSPDGRQIAFISSRDSDGYEVYVMNADGSNEHRLTNKGNLLGKPIWVP